MEFKEIREAMKGVEFDQTRADAYNYFEAVVMRDKLPALSEKLAKIFGEPLFPSNKKISAEMEKVIEDFGGVRDGQTLYCINEKEHCYFAMLWPWSDEYHITVKIGRK